MERSLVYLPSQAYRSQDDVSEGDAHHGRQPLQELAGNVNNNGGAHMYNTTPAPYTLNAFADAEIARINAHILGSTERERDRALKSLGPYPSPPVVPTQALSQYGHMPPAYTRQHDQHRVHQQQQRQNTLDDRINPLWQSPVFQTHRARQHEKEGKDEKWPDILEYPFLDALILIPHLERKKFTIKMKQFGRNELIGMYLWLAYCESLPPGVKPDEKMGRKRKQVSSHIQVLKGLFQFDPCYSIFFPPKRRDDKKYLSGSDQSFKNNAVLLALAAGHLPNIRPNYGYLNNIVRMHEQISVKPKRNWMFVTHKTLEIHLDGSATFPETGQELTAEEYPRLVDNLDRDRWSKEERFLISGVLLHEFAKDLEQRESSSVTEVSHDWKHDFPALYQRLESVVEAKAGCDYLHMHVTLEMKGEQGRGRFPDSSSLNSIMALDVEQKALEHHRWRVHTTMMIPAELTTDGEADQIFEETKACRHLGNSKVADDHHRDSSVHVSFPADAWAPVLSTCAEYPAHPVVGAGDRGRRQGKRDGEDDKDDMIGLTQMELVPRIAMMQEVSSSPPPHTPISQSLYGTEDAAHSAEAKWERRAVILWTFETVHSISSKKNKPELVTLPQGRTSWRFLTPLDPTSPAHQQQSVQEVTDAHFLPFTLPNASALSLGSLDGGGPGSVASPETMRDSIMSPSPGYQQTLNADMSENLHSTWDPAGVVHGYGSYGAAAPHRPGGLSLLDTSGVYGTSHHGLATPPPSASLVNSFHTSFDGGHHSSYGHHSHYHHDVTSHAAGPLVGYMSSSTPKPVDSVHHAGHGSLAASSHPSSSSGSLCGLAAVTDPFLTADEHAHGTCATGHETWADWDTSATTPYAAGSISGAMASNTAVVAQNGSHGDVLDWHSSPAAGAGPVSASGGDEDGDQWMAVTAESTPTLRPAAMRAGEGGAAAHGDVAGDDWVDVAQQAGEDGWLKMETPESWREDDGLGLGHQRTASNSTGRQENEGSVQNTPGGRGGGGPNRALSVLDLARYTLSPIKGRGTKRSRADSLEDRENHPLGSNPKLTRVQGKGSPSRASNGDGSGGW